MEYHIGPEGASVGSSSSATVSLPSVTGLLPNHFEIRWIPGEGVFLVTVTVMQ